jgi:hypothetical protein
LVTRAPQNMKMAPMPMSTPSKTVEPTLTLTACESLTRWTLAWSVVCRHEPYRLVQSPTKHVAALYAGLTRTSDRNCVRKQ